MESERPIEKLLRGYAKKRREQTGAPVELHPATRRMLQSEVARKFPRGESPPRTLATAFSQFWLKFAWGMGISAVLATAAWLAGLGTGQKTENRFASSEERKPDMLTPSPLAGPATTASGPAQFQPGTDRQLSAPSDRDHQDVPLASAASAAPPEPGKDLKSGVEEPAPAAKRAPTTPQSASIPPNESLPAVLPPTGAANGSADTGFTRRYGLAGSPPQPTAPAAVPMKSTADELALAQLKKSPQPDNLLKKQSEVVDQKALANNTAASSILDNSLSYANVQQFNQVPAKTKVELLFDKKVPAGNVLVSFKLEQSGEGVRIVDADGSVYSGNLRASSAAQSKRSPGAISPATARSFRDAQPNSKQRSAPVQDTLQNLASYSFRVAGTNRSLNQRVVFTGELMGFTNASAWAQTANDYYHNQALSNLSNNQAPPAQLNNRLDMLLQNSHISGKAVVDGRHEIQIEAEPALEKK